MPLAQNPKAETAAPGAIPDAHEGGVTTTVPEDWLGAPFHESRMAVPAGRVKARLQLDTCVPPVFLTVRLRHRPVSHVESWGRAWVPDSARWWFRRPW